MQEVDQSRRIWVLVCSVFGPYLLAGAGFRVEQVYVYSVAVIILTQIAMRPSSTRHVPGEIGFAMVLWAVFGLLVTVQTALPPPGLRVVSDGFYRTISVLDSHALPLGIFIVLAGSGVLVGGAIGTTSLNTAARAILTCLTINTVIGVLAVKFDLTFILRHFWSDSGVAGVRGTVAERGLEAGRIGGVFNQPFDAGLGYAAGSALWCYLAVQHPRGTSRRGLALYASGVAIGGIASTSKVFIYGAGLVVVTFILCSSSTTRARRVVGGLSIVAAVLVAGPPAARGLGLPGVARTVSRFSFWRSDDPIGVIFGGRIDASGVSVGRAVDWSDSWFLGVGYRVEHGSLDNGYVAALIGAGALGLGLLLALIALLAHACRQRLRETGRSNSAILATCNLVLIIFANVGAPALSVNRGSSLVWIILLISLSCTATVPTLRQRGSRKSV